MENPFEYPADRSEFFEGSSEEEAHFYFTLADFEQLIIDHGPDFVFNRMHENIFQQVATWFLDDDE